MSLSYDDVDFGAELPPIAPDVTLAYVKRFTTASGMTFGRFHDHEQARKEGLRGDRAGNHEPGNPGRAIHCWAPNANVRKSTRSSARRSWSTPHRSLAVW
jgi:hypothetical protein